MVCRLTRARKLVGKRAPRAVPIAFPGGAANKQVKEKKIRERIEKLTIVSLLELGLSRKVGHDSGDERRRRGGRVVFAGSLVVATELSRRGVVGDGRCSQLGGDVSCDTTFEVFIN